jgi:ATP-GRASP peptide maturase of grasp-with-spasm system
MVLIISKDLEPSTDKVIDWLYYMGVPFQRVNGEEILSSKMGASLYVDKDHYNIQFSGKIAASLKDVSAVWYRRDGGTKQAPIPAPLHQEEYIKDVRYHLSQELLIAKKGLYGWLEAEKCILGNFNRSTLNKIEVLNTARVCGLDVPATLITRSKEELIRFVEAHGPVITKALWESQSLMVQEEEQVSYTSFTEEITDEILETIPQQFYYSLFQEKLDKALDLRVFFLDGECYSMAIFSQLLSQTSIDFRKYANNRNVPFRLPASISDRIRELMKALNLNTGSIDIVKTKDGRYVFLEVNPVGQYDMTSVPCNYQLDKKIAQFLSQYEQ